MGLGRVQAVVSGGKHLCDKHVQELFKVGLKTRKPKFKAKDPT
jgi:hypothetical protein